MIDLNNADTQAVRTLLALREPGSEASRQLLALELDGAKQKLVHADDMVKVHRLQGRAEAFEDLLSAIEASPKVANRS